jgi:peptidoglycan/xylan/chitin deacetylase (PgdA/CDA1 family)
MSEPMSEPLELTVWMYHYVRDRGDAAEAGSGIPGLPVARFAEQLDEMARHNHMVSWPEVRAAAARMGVAGQPLPPDATLLTFDDGTRDHYLNVFPLLKARGLSGLFFVLARPPGAGLVLGHKIHYLLAIMPPEDLRAAVLARLSPEAQQQFAQAEAQYRARFDPGTPAGATDLLKSVLQRELSAPAESVLSDLIAQHLGDEAALAASYYLSSAQTREMSAGGMHFGGHSVTHPWFNFIPAEQQATEIAASAAWLAGIEPGPWAFAYPYGGLSPHAPALLAQCGFAAAFTTQGRLRHTDPFYIGRLDGEELDAVKSLGGRYA